MHMHRARSLALAGVLLASVVAAAQAQPAAEASEPRIVEVARRVSLRTLTQEKARRRALDEAQAEAVRQVVGTQVQAEQSSVTTETSGGEFADRFTQVVRTGASGRVVDYDVLGEGVVVGARGDAYYEVRLRATVQPEQGRPDPGFTATLTLDDADGVYLDCGAPTDSDELVATAQVSQDAHVTLFSLTADTLQVIWPNALMPEAAMLREVPVEFPPPDLRARGVHLRVEVPPGREEVTEHLVLVATKTDVPFRPLPAFEVRNQELTTAQAHVLALQRWLVRLPLDQRTMATTTYYVHRAQC